MDVDWSESRYDEREDSPVREHYDDDGVDRSSRHRSKDRKKSDKDHRGKDRDQAKRVSEDVEKERGSGRERIRDEREKERSKDGKVRERDYDREKYREKERERERDKKDRGKDREREKEREIEKDSERVREKERGKEKTRDRERDKGKEREKHRDRESYRDGDRDKGKDKIREEREADREKDRSRDRGSRKAHEEDYESGNLDDRVDYHEKRDEDVGKHEKASKINQDDKEGETSANLSSKELEERILKMKETRTKKQSEISSWLNKSRKLEKERVLQLSKIFEEQDNIAVEGSDDEDTTHHTDHLAGVKVLHGLDKVAEGGTVVLTIRDQPILADGDINEDIDMLENVEIGEQKRRDDAYKAAKKKTGIYDDKFNDDPSSEKKILPKYDDPAAEEGLTLDERGRFSGEAEKRLEELRRRLTGGSTNNFEDLTSSGKVSSDYYSHEEMLQFKKPKKKKSLRKKDKLDINALEAEAVSSGLGIGDLGSRKDAKRQAIKDEQERLAAETRNNAYQTAYAKADEASKLLRPEQSPYVKAEEDETPVFADDDEDLRKSLEKARRLALKKQEEKGASGPQAIALLASLNPSNENVDDQNAAAGESKENKVVLTEMEEFVWGLHIDEEARRPDGEDVFMQDDEEAPVPVEEKEDEAGGWTEVNETQIDEQPNSEDKEEIVPDETIHEVAVGKGLSGALKLLKDRGTLKESVEWGGRNMDKKKSKLVGIVEDDGKEAPNKKEIHIERTDEFGRILTPKEAFRIISHKFHGKGPGKMKQEKRMKQFYEELKLKQMKSSDTPSMSVERMREAQARNKTPYLVLSGHVKAGQTSDPKSGFATVEKDLPGGLTPMLGDRKVEHFLGIKRKAEQSSSDTPSNSGTPKKSKS